MKRAEAEKAIKSLALQWHQEQTAPRPDIPSYGCFKEWAQKRGYGHNFNFRSGCGADIDAEMWFDQALKQTWRN